jgi:hypothetical protein
MQIKVFTAISNQTNSMGSHNSSHPKLPKGGTPMDICFFLALIAKPKARVMTCCGSTIFNSKLTLNLS